jgi:hypothetical protein
LSGATSRGTRPACHGKIGQIKDFRKSVPAGKPQQLVGTHQEHKACIRALLSAQFLQGVSAVAGTVTADFAGIDFNWNRYPFERQPQHGKTIVAAGVQVMLLPGKSGRNDPHHIKCQALSEKLGKRDVGQMGWIKTATQHADAAQSHARGTRKRLVSCSSGDPGAVFTS